LADRGDSIAGDRGDAGALSEYWLWWGWWWLFLNAPLEDLVIIDVGVVDRS
jgi:hypothetical protein